MGNQRKDVQLIRGQ